MLWIISMPHSNLMMYIIYRIIQQAKKQQSPELNTLYRENHPLIHRKTGRCLNKRIQQAQRRQTIAMVAIGKKNNKYNTQNQCPELAGQIEHASSHRPPIELSIIVG